MNDLQISDLLVFESIKSGKLSLLKCTINNRKHYLHGPLTGNIFWIDVRDVVFENNEEKKYTVAMDEFATNSNIYKQYQAAVVSTEINQQRLYLKIIKL